MYNDLADLDVGIGKRYNLMSIFFRLKILSQKHTIPSYYLDVRSKQNIIPTRLSYGIQMELSDWYKLPTGYLACDATYNTSTRGDFMIILKLLKIVEHYETKWVLHG